jgi:prepilin-type processing-associated H-X9-DG protein
MRRDRLQFKKRFTLIELLVVITIIMILGSFLLPALNQAKNKSKTMFCQSNLKNLGYSLRSYIDDNIGYYMPRNSSPSGWWWGLRLAYFSEIRNSSVFLCPSDTSPLKMVFFDSYPTTALRSCSYGYGAVDGKNERKFRVSPSKVCILVDLDSWYTFSGSSSNWDANKTLRHNSGSNLLFSDSHTEWIKTFSISNTSNDYPWYN